MPFKPLACGPVLATALLTVSACSAGGSTHDPGTTPKTPGGGTSTTTGNPTKLVKLTGKDDIKNVYAKTSTGKISLSAKSPGHEIMEQVYDADAKTWSDPTSVFKDTTRFCHSIKIKSKASTIAATVSCSISLQDVDGTQSSYVLGSNDGTTWKRADLSGASGKPALSPTGNYVQWGGPNAFVLWNPANGTFTTVKYTQTAEMPTIGVIRSNGQLVMVKAIPGKKDTCSVSFLSASATAATPHVINTTLPQAGHPHCVATSGKMQGPELIANFEQTQTIKDDKGQKTTTTTTFAYAFVQADGKWVIKS